VGALGTALNQTQNEFGPSLALSAGRGPEVICLKGGYCYQAFGERPAIGVIRGWAAEGGGRTSWAVFSGRVTSRKM